MKNKLTLVLAMTFFIFNANAQNEKGKSVVTVGLGYSLVNNIVKTSLETYADVDISSVPTIAATYDYAITDRFSIGLAGVYQSVSGEFTNSFFDEFDVIEEKAKASFSRINVAIRPLFHYGGNEKLDMYSGLRVGMLLRNTTQESNDPNLATLADLDGSRLSVGLVLFGMRYFFTDNIGISADIQMGTPYVVSAGASFKF